MKTAVVGSRTITDYALVKTILDQYEITQIVSGGARGIDSLAEQYSAEHNLEHAPKIFKPDWDKFGRSAGIIRNKDIVDYADVVIAIWDGVSKGTLFSITYAKKQDKTVHIHEISLLDK